MPGKINVTVEVRIDPEGRKTPLRIMLPDGMQLEVDEVLDVRMAAALRSGGQGMRYQCRMSLTDEMGEGHSYTKYLFEEGDDGTWFVEGKG